jgi:beta-galactosidase
MFRFDFASPHLNLTHFLLLAQQNNLNVLLRPGPYICSEWDNGGLPWWLLKYDGIQVRTYDTT